MTTQKSYADTMSAMKVLMSSDFAQGHSSVCTLTRPTQLPLSVTFPWHHHVAYQHSNLCCFYYASCVAESYSHLSHLTFRDPGSRMSGYPEQVGGHQLLQMCVVPRSRSFLVTIQTFIEFCRYLFRFKLHDPSYAHAR